MLRKVLVAAVGIIATSGIASAQVGVNVGFGLPLPNGGYINVGTTSGYTSYPYTVPTNYPVQYPNGYPVSYPTYSTNGCGQSYPTQVYVPQVVTYPVQGGYYNQGSYYNQGNYGQSCRPRRNRCR